jgi:GNAT superfamily N-acetyltransferase
MLIVREADKDDLRIVQGLALMIWPVAYNAIISAAQIDYMLMKMYSLEVLEKQLSENQKFVILYDSAEPVGFASFGPKPNDEKEVYRLNKLYLLPTRQGKGIGKFLLDFIVGAVSKIGGRVLELNVNKQNPARDFYARNGFDIIREEVLDIGNGNVMDDYVMQLKLSQAN